MGEEISSLVNVAATNVGALTMMAPLSPTPHVAPANQYEYGQYYLYENLLDDTNGIFAGSTDSSNLATLALLGGLGGGSPLGGYYPSPSGYSQVPSGQGRRRRSACLW